MMSLDKFYGCLLGCAIGDSIGLPFEGLSSRRIKKLDVCPAEQCFMFGFGSGSDDIDHTIFIAQSLPASQNDGNTFARIFSSKLKTWLFSFPAGIGLATLKGIIRLWLGFTPQQSGVYSAGNAPAMRSAIIGVYYAEDQTRRNEFVKISTRITHTDPKAEYAARAVAEIAACLTAGQWIGRPSPSELKNILLNITDDKEWTDLAGKIYRGCLNKQPERFLESINCATAVSGYCYHTVPFAIVAWYRHFGDFRATIEECLKAGGDTDTTAAIAGALSGITVGEAGIPESWKKRYVDLAHGKEFIKNTAARLHKQDAELLSNKTWKLTAKGAVLTLFIILHLLRRFLPPY